MTAAEKIGKRPEHIGLRSDKPLSIAILAMGGQGGGVLADWIVALAEANGWSAQTTSVPGVAQRTGATIYYVEMIAARDGLHPIFSLMPMPGDVDIVIAAEYMEAGRSILRGLVTPDRTTLIASTHRSFAVVEKEKPGDGTADSALVTAAGMMSAKRSIAFDMEEIAQRSGSVISASMFGALAASEALPFARRSFEATIASGGRGVRQSLEAFDLAFAAAAKNHEDHEASERPAFELPHKTGQAQLDRLLDRIGEGFPAKAHPILLAGAQRLVDYQDPAYADEYLDRVAIFAGIDRNRLKGTSALTEAAAKHIANAMSFDDVIKVADLKTRPDRFARIRTEVSAAEGQLLYTTEFMHPRMEEAIGMLPPTIGTYLERRPRLIALLDRVVNRGRRMNTGRIGAFLVLYLIAGMKKFRRGTLRFSRERAHMDHWLDLAGSCAAIDYDLGVELLGCRRLVKGYSDTHARGMSKFDRVIAAAPLLVGKPSGPQWLRNLVQAALADEDDLMLQGALRTVAENFG